MKKRLLIILAAFVLLAGWNLWPEKVEKVEVYKMHASEGEKSITISDSKSVRIFRNAFRNAKKQPGIVDMAEPDYKVAMGNKIYFLWIDEEHGTIMNIDDTHRIYALSHWSVVKIGILLSSRSKFLFSLAKYKQI
ncbi:hypothetical protein [Bacillus infantis]|uniref:hypothetical protein n=1 Tax=Bacillus infantis TaxID=324767 RepID=UPI003CF9678E